MCWGPRKLRENMATFVIGRAPPSDKPRIVLDDRTVSRTHGAIDVSGGRCILSDADSTSGTFVRQQGQWRRISTAIVEMDDRVRFGAYVITIGELLERATEPVPDGPRRIERNPETGEIVKKGR